MDGNPAESTGVPIFIDGNEDFEAQAALNGWPGDGTEMGPYTIADLSILIDGNTTPIDICNTNVFFEISNCSMSPICQEDVEWNSYSSAVKLMNVSNGQLSHIWIKGFVYGVRMEGCSDITLDNSTLSGSMGGNVKMWSSTRLVLENNTITKSGHNGVEVNHSDNILIQCNNVSYNTHGGFSFHFQITDSLIRWNVASRNGYKDGWHGWRGNAIFIAGTGNVIYGNIFVSPGDSDSMPAAYGYGAKNKWSSPDWYGNYYGTNYDSESGTFTSFLGEPLCSTVDHNLDDISDSPFYPSNGASNYDGIEVDYCPLIRPIASLKGLTVSLNAESIIVEWGPPSYMTWPLGHYVVTRDDGTSTLETEVDGTSYEDPLSVIDGRSTIEYSVKCVSGALVSPPSYVVAQNPDHPSVVITSPLGENSIVFGDEVIYANETLDPRSVRVEWEGFDSNSITMFYRVRLDDGGWVDVGQVSTYTFTDLIEGLHTVTVKATDVDMNEAECSKTFSVFRMVDLSVTYFPLVEGDDLDLILTGQVRDMVTGEGISNLDLSVAYSTQRGRSWDFTSATTGEDGSFLVSIDFEMEVISGIMLTTTVMDDYSDEHSHFENVTYTAVNLDGRSGAFLAESSSTISDFMFSSNMMRFNVTGDYGTKGSTTIMVPKDAVHGIDDVSVLIDGVEAQFSTVERDEYWELTIDYTHSTHEITVDIAPNGIFGLSGGGVMIILLIAICVIIVISIILFKRRNGR